ncbi:MAG TPA: type VI secretion system tip protein TssI/VgrG [Ignavibacteriaceae bacterium]|nr:type VI secretion system tip protein TssI/VgrG [Ignavibacteriaceae bacterium]
MVDYKHNQPYYELHLSNLKDGTLKVLSFEGEEEISSLFEYRIDLVSDDPEIDSSKILNEPATFYLNRGDEDPVKIHGIISSFEQFGKTSDYVFYKAVLVPQIWRMSLVFQNEVYQHINIEKIIEMLMEDIGLSKQNFKIDLKDKYPEKEYIVQYRETNLNFLNRRIEHFGIYYYFDHTGDKDIIVFTDSNNKLPALPSEENIGYNINKDPFSENESVREITCREKVVTGSVQLKDYNYMFPDKQLLGQSQMDGHPGLYYDYGDDFENEDEAESLAKIRNQEFLAGSKIFAGKSDCRYFSAGYKFKLEKHYRESWNSEYVITKVKHIGNQQGLFGLLPPSSKLLPTYENSFTAIPSEIEYRPSRKTPVPKITGIMSAKIDSGSDDILIDDHGRYFAKMHFDLSDKNGGEATLPIRLTQAYSGSGYGIHFPNHGGTELLWACVDGNVDRPIGIGTIPNPSNASPSVDANKTQSVIRTAADNEIVIEDKSGDEQIHINQACGNEIHMKASGPDIEIKQKNGNQILMKDSGPEIEIQQACGNKIIMKEADGIHMKDKYGNEVKLDAAAGFIRIASPSHNSWLELGKSLKWSTDSIVENLCGKDTNWKVIGLTNETFVGGKYQHVIGHKHETTVLLETRLNKAKSINIIDGGASLKSRQNVKITAGLAGKITLDGKELNIENIDTKIKFLDDGTLRVHASNKIRMTTSKSIQLGADGNIIFVSKNGKPIELKTDDVKIKAAIKQKNITVEKD